MGSVYLESNLQQYSARIQQALIRFLPDINLEPQSLHQAMHYAVLNGGKRIRPLLVYAASELFNFKQDEFLDRAAAAVEFIHCYSLVHDDLPTIDDDDLRRGKPTCHRAFDEATAILVGDALQALAFKILSQEMMTEISATKRLQVINLLSTASSSLNLVGGQYLDLQAEGKILQLSKLEQIHKMKTGALIVASVLMGAIISCREQESLENLTHFATSLGLAFQIQDDILDIEKSTEQLGKRQGADHALNKPTFASILGIEEAKKYLNKVYQNALSYLKAYEACADNLRNLATFIVMRET